MRSVVFALVGCVVCSTLGCSDDPAQAPPHQPSALEQEVEARIAEAVAAGFSGSVLVAVDGQRIAASGHGLADREHEVPNTEHTAFDFGSVMKDLTAGAIFQLEAGGVLALSDTLGALLPDVPADKAEITLLQIVQHRAGFDEFHDTEGDFEPMTRAEARERILAQQLLFEPGTDEAYSNSGYTLLADIVETLSGEPFIEYLRHLHFEAAGMAESGFFSDGPWDQVDTAIGYDSATFGDNDPATWPYTWSLMGNGGLVTSVVDMERWLVALWEGRILDAGAFEAMQAQYLSTGSVTLGGEEVYFFAGAGDYGLGGAAIEVPAKGTRVIIASNSYDAFDSETFAVELISDLLERN